MSSAAPSLWRLGGMNLFWFASQGLWNATYILIALSADMADAAHEDLIVGAATTVGGVIAVAVPIAAGALSDRTTSRWGPRVPWIVGGTMVNVIGVVLLAAATTPPWLLVAYSFFQLGNNAAGAAFAGVIPDRVPTQDRGGASGLLNTSQIVGTVAYLGLTLAVLSHLGSTRAGVASMYLLLGLVLLLGLAASVPFIAAARPADWQPPSSSLSLAELWEPLRDQSFRWVLATRFLQTLGIWTILPFVTFYFQDVTHASNPGAVSSLWQLAVLAGGIPPALLCGFLSDRIGRRKPFVYAASAMQAGVAAVLLVTLVSNLWLLYVLGVLFGIGYGAYSAVDWALACDTLPEAGTSTAKDMGMFHVSYTLPQVFAPALLAPVLYRLNQGGARFAGIATGSNLGFRVVFASAALWFLLATVMVRRITRVK